MMEGWEKNLIDSIDRPNVRLLTGLTGSTLSPPVVTDTDDRVSLESGGIDRRDRLIESRIRRRLLFGDHA